MLFAAVGVVVQLWDEFNTVWEVDAKKVSGIWQFIRAYLVSLAAVLSLVVPSFGFIGVYHRSLCCGKIFQPTITGNDVTIRWVVYFHSQL